MKICPKCSKTYDDETLNFCLDDGSVLTQGQIPAPEEPPPTVMMPQSPPAPVTEHQPQAAPTEQTWEAPPRYEPSSGGKSRSWIWAILILLAVVILCGGGIVGLLAISSLDREEDPVATPSEEAGRDDLETAPEDPRAVRFTDDLSTWKGSLRRFEGLESRYSNGELFLNTRKGFYYVISTGQNFRTYDASVRITVRSSTGDPSSLGYGIVVHSDPARVLSRDYAFLISSDARRYRVVRHLNQKESVLVGWTGSSAIRTGTRENALEVRMSGNEMRFYINGVFIRTVKDFSRFKRGVAGVYTSDDTPIAFSNLELRK